MKMFRAQQLCLRDDERTKAASRSIVPKCRMPFFGHANDRNDDAASDAARMCIDR
jgi:hypothetical protein